MFLDVVKMEFQVAQGQMAWLASRGQETSDHIASVEWELKHLWVMVRLGQKYVHHLIKEHLAPLQHSYPSVACQCAIMGDFQQSPIPTSFRDLHSPVSFGHDSPPPFWEELNAIVEAKVPSLKLEGGSANEASASALEDVEEAWEDVGSGGSGGGGSGGEGSA